MSSKNSFFNPEWADPQMNPQWSPWLQGIEGAPHMARCIFCQKSIYLSNMGQQAITSHMDGIKHKNLVSIKNSTQSMKRFFNSETSTSAPKQSSMTVVESLSQQSVLNSYVIKGDVLAAELLWAMKLVYSHISFNSFNDAALLFQKMFDDSEKAKAMPLGRAKMSYLVSFGLAPYFKKMLISQLKETEFVICFDEALNRIVQKGQMDLYIRFWNSVNDEVSTRYLTSVFLGHATASDLLRSFFEATSELNKKKLLQVHLDGPNVNVKFL